MAQRHATVDEYLASFPPDTREILQQVRATFLKALPDAQEVISYQIAAFKVDGATLVYFGGWKHHVGVYPVPVFDDELERLVAPYRSTKDTLKFLYKRPIPHELIGQILAEMRRRRT